MIIELSEQCHIVLDGRILLLIMKRYLLFCFILHPFYCYLESVLFTFFPKSTNCGQQSEITSSGRVHRLLAPRGGEIYTWDEWLVCMHSSLMVWTVKMVLFVFLCCHSCVLSGSYVGTIIHLHNEPEINIECLILHVSALLVIFGLLSEFNCQAGVEET